MPKNHASEANRYFVYDFGELTGAYFAGKFSCDLNLIGFDKVGAYGAFAGVYQFFLNTDGIGDLVPTYVLPRQRSINSPKQEGSFLV